jgi:putative Mg2+ transporter-C (MgtC) family protein
MISNFELLLRLLLSALIGGAIGAEREVSNRPAGLRTHILVSVGSTLIMLVSVYAFSGADPSRLAAQVVSGIGFLGAGTIIRTGNDIKGLTTAASLWVCAGIGLAIGSGYYLGGIITAGIVLISLIALGSIEKRVRKNLSRVIHILAKERPGLVGDIGTLFGKYFITIKEITILEHEELDDEFIDISFTVKTPTGLDMQEVINELYNVQMVTKVVLDGKIVNINDNH